MRIDFFVPVTICWTGPDGKQRHLTANALDLCTYGMGIESPEAIPKEAQVSVEVKAFGFSGEAEVRRCQARGTRFNVGLLFDSVLPFFLDAKRASRGLAATPYMKPEAPKKQVTQGEAAQKQTHRSGSSLSERFA